MNKSIELFESDSTNFLPSFVTPFIEYVCIGAPESGYKYFDNTVSGLSSLKRSTELLLTRLTKILIVLFFIIYFFMVSLWSYANIGHNGLGLCEVGAFKAQMFNLAQMFIRITNA